MEQSSSYSPHRRMCPTQAASFLPVEETLKPAVVVTAGCGRGAWRWQGYCPANTDVHSQVGARRVMVLHLPAKLPFSISRAGVLSERLSAVLETSIFVKQQHSISSSSS